MAKSAWGLIPLPSEDGSAVWGLGLVQRRGKSLSLTWRRSLFLKHHSLMCKGKLWVLNFTDGWLRPETCGLCEERLFCKDSVRSYPTILWAQSFDQCSVSLWTVVVTSAPELFPEVELQSQGIVFWERETCALCRACKAAAAPLIKTYVLHISVCLSVSLFLMKFLDKGSFSNYPSASWCSPSLFIFAIMPFFNLREQIRPYQSFEVY